MEVIRIYLVVVITAVVFSLIMPSISAQAPTPTPTPAPAPVATSDGVTIDQGVAYLLMLVALALTYIIH